MSGCTGDSVTCCQTAAGVNRSSTRWVSQRRWINSISSGWSIVYEPAAVLYHFESQSRVAGIHPEEIELIQRRWLTHLVDDRFTPAVV